MKKEGIRKEFFKLKNKGHPYPQCKSILKAKHNFEITIRTLKRWIKCLDAGNWDLCDSSKRPRTIRYKVSEELKRKVISLRNKTGWGGDKLELYFPLPHTTINKILNEANLSNESKSNDKRKKVLSGNLCC